MNNPCTCNNCHVGMPYTGGQCRLCWLRWNDRRYARLFGKSTLGMAGTCKHLGEEVGRVLCPSCRGHVEVKTFACAEFGSCTQGKQVGDLACCDTCARAPVQVHVTSTGIGDTLLALTAAAGLRVAGGQVLFCCREAAAPWAGLFDAYDWLATAPNKQLRSHAVYDSNAQGPTADASRAQLYARRCGAAPVLPPARALPAEARRWAGQYAGAVALAPWAAWPDRCWPVANWHRLAVLLSGGGQRVVVLDGRRDRAGDFLGDRVLGESPERVAALADVTTLVGNDSGMAHLWGLRRRPAVVVCGHPQGDRIFDVYPRVQVVLGLDCRPEQVYERL